MNTLEMLAAAKANPGTVFHDRASPVACRYELGTESPIESWHSPGQPPAVTWDGPAWRSWDTLSGTDCPLPESDWWEAL